MPPRTTRPTHNVSNKTKTDQHLEILFIDGHSGDLCLKIFMACTIRKTLETKGNLVTRLQFSHQSLSIQPFLQLPGFFLRGEKVVIEDIEAAKDEMPLEYRLLKAQDIHTVIVFL